MPRIQIQVPSIALALGLAAGAGSQTPATEVRAECFALALETPVEGEPQHVGLARLSRTEVGGDTLLEWELTFAADELQVLHVERFDPAGAKLVWREVGRGRGRTVLAELASEGSTLRVVDWSSERAREDVLVETSALLPLAQLELARRGELCDGAQSVFDPLSRALEVRETRTRFEPAPVAGGGASQATPGEREVEARRADGTLAWSARFRGDELVGYRWQAGGLVARRISAAEFERERLALAPAAVESGAPLARVKSE